MEKLLKRAVREIIKMEKEMWKVNFRCQYTLENSVQLFNKLDWLCIDDIIRTRKLVIYNI